MLDAADNTAKAAAPSEIQCNREYRGFFSFSLFAFSLWQEYKSRKLPIFTTSRRPAQYAPIVVGGLVTEPFTYS